MGESKHTVRVLAAYTKGERDAAHKQGCKPPKDRRLRKAYMNGFKFVKSLS